MKNSFNIFTNETNEQVINWALDNLMRELSNINMEKKELDKNIVDFIVKYNLLTNKSSVSCLHEIFVQKANKQSRIELNQIDEKSEELEDEEIFYDTVEDLPKLQGTLCTNSENSILSYGAAIKLNMVNL